MTIIEINNLTKHFKQHNIFTKNQVTAVDNLSLKIQRGEIFAFLGPN